MREGPGVRVYVVKEVVNNGYGFNHGSKEKYSDHESSHHFFIHLQISTKLIYGDRLLAVFVMMFPDSLHDPAGGPGVTTHNIFNIARVDHHAGGYTFHGGVFLNVRFRKAFCILSLLHVAAGHQADIPAHHIVYPAW
jgi:hypothetical protein